MRSMRIFKRIPGILGKGQVRLSSSALLVVESREKSCPGDEVGLLARWMTVVARTNDIIIRQTAFCSKDSLECRTRIDL